MPDLPLDIRYVSPGVALVPGAVEFLGGPPELDNEIIGEVLTLGLAPFLLPEAD
jgi:hypothetical protein